MMFAALRNDGDDRLLVVVNAGRERETQAVTHEQLDDLGQEFAVPTDSLERVVAVDTALRGAHGSGPFHLKPPAR